MDKEKEHLIMIADLLMILYKITDAEDARDMYDLAVDGLEKYGVKPARLH